MDEYKGFITLKLDNEAMAKFYQNNYDVASLNLYENEFVFIQDSTDAIVDSYCFEGGRLIKVAWKPFKTDALGQVKPLNKTQELGFYMLQSSKTTVKMFDADYGVGKSYLCANYMLESLQRGKFQKAILIRPNIGLEDYPSLGSIPGDYLQKNFPWFAWLCDIVGSADHVMRMVEDNQIELVPLETLRGRSFMNSLIYVEECGNLTPAACRLIVSRCGEGSQLLMCGDQSQADKKKFREDSGIAAMKRGLVGNPLFSYLKLEGCVRSKTAQLCELF